MRIGTLFAAVILLVALTGCASFGEKFDPALVDQLDPGVSTVQDAVALLGPYNGQSVMPDGTRIYTWMYSSTNTLTGKSEARSVGLSFRPDGKLYTKSENTTQGRF
jgi:hypothetical protein